MKSTHGSEFMRLLLVADYAIFQSGHPYIEADEKNQTFWESVFINNDRYFVGLKFMVYKYSHLMVLLFPHGTSQKLKS